MQTDQQDLFEHKIFSLNPFRKLFSVLLIIAIVFVIVSFFSYFFLGDIIKLLGLNINGNLNSTVIIFLFLGYGFVQQSMLRKVMIIEDFQEKVKAYYKFYKLRILLVFTILIVSCITLVLNGNGSQFFWILINFLLFFLLKPNPKIILSELKESDITFNK